MAVYFVQGKLGAGKSLASVGRIRDYLEKGRRVATNLDIYLEHMFPSTSRAVLTRIPDKPRLSDLEAIGQGYEGPYLGEEHNGLLVLDELGTWFNSRSWQDKERAHVLDWCLHARKYRWDIIFIVQDISIVDKQLRESLCEHLVVCRRLDRLTIPFVGRILKLITGRRAALPKIHVAAVYYGDNEQSIKVDRWWYRAGALKDAYDTEQVFVQDQIISSDGVTDMRAMSTTLSAWHVKGRYEVRRPFTWYLTAALVMLMLPLIILSAFLSGRSLLAEGQRLGIWTVKASA